MNIYEEFSTTDMTKITFPAWKDIFLEGLFVQYRIMTVQCLNSGKTTKALEYQIVGAASFSNETKIRNAFFRNNFGFE